MNSNQDNLFVLEKILGSLICFVSIYLLYQDFKYYSLVINPNILSPIGNPLWLIYFKMLLGIISFITGISLILKKIKVKLVLKIIMFIILLKISINVIYHI